MIMATPGGRGELQMALDYADMVIALDCIESGTWDHEDGVHLVMRSGGTVTLKPCPIDPYTFEDRAAYVFELWHDLVETLRAQPGNPYDG